ncbi:MAG: hypothetical protein DCC67_14555 [Planctomycetota bacterium]|nr:MAG: hypothetical protein DCC67_14555 [Planctomycetota bacterium]
MPRASADTLISGFEGDLSTTLGADWVLADTDTATPGDQIWTSAFVAEGVTEGTQALQVTQPVDAWQHGLLLNSTALIPIVASSDTLEFDFTVSPDATWRAVWVIMQGDGLSWAQADQVDGVPGSTVHAVIDLTAPAPSNPEMNWKTAAAASGGTWWQMWFAIMGGDNFSPETYTIIDNIKFVGGPTGSPSDFDDNGFVDGGDLEMWKTAFGVDATADADGDLDSDGADLLQWQRDFAPAAPAVGAVPEPTALAILASAAAACLAVRRARRRI